MNQTSFATAFVDEFAGTTKVQRDKWIKAWHSSRNNPQSGGSSFAAILDRLLE
jgi:hypothetical protein